MFSFTAPSLTTPTADGETLNYTYDTVSSAMSMCGTPAGGGTAVCYASNRTEGFDAYGRVAYTEFKLGNNLYNRQSFSGNLGRLDNLKVGTTAGGSDRLSRSYTYDAIGNINTIVDPLASQTHTYTYDHLDRLTAWSVTGSNPTSESYSYDTIGNITSKTGIAGGYTYPAAGQARPHAPTAVGGQSYSYEPNGNLTSGGGRTLTWDYDNKPATVTPAGGSIFTAESYQYGADGERIKKTVGNVTTYYFGLLEEEVNAGTGVTTRRLQYKWGGSVIAQREKATTSSVETVVYLAGDHLGSVSVATNASGGYVTPGSPQQLFDPWGKVRSGTLTSTTTLNYTGQKLDATGLLFYNARYYDPSIAKFVSSDTIIPNKLDPQSYNGYSYVRSNPVKYIDPTGHCDESAPGVRDTSTDRKAQCWIEYDKAVAANDGKEPDGLKSLDTDRLKKLTVWLLRGIRLATSAGKMWKAEIVDHLLEALRRTANYLGEHFDRVMGIGVYGNLTFEISDHTTMGLGVFADQTGRISGNKFNSRIRLSEFEFSQNPERNAEALVEVIIHEFGHQADFTYGRAGFSSGEMWQRSRATREGGMNEAAQNDQYEDYAETFTWLVQAANGKASTRAVLRRTGPDDPRKFAVILSLFFGGRDPNWPSR